MLRYARGFVPNHIIVEERGGPYAINDVEVTASIRHQHPVETYGLHFRYEGCTVSYLPCTRYFEALIDDYRAHAPDVLIINVLRYADSMNVDHLTLDQAKLLIGAIAPKAAIMTHFGTKMLERDPRKLAYELEDELGVRVYAAYDGWTYDAPIRGSDVA
jgi:phosphoribosyl 1,2-cyclic phosphodiesterase